MKVLVPSIHPYTLDRMQDIHRSRVDLDDSQINLNMYFLEDFGKTSNAEFDWNYVVSTARQTLVRLLISKHGIPLILLKKKKKLDFLDHY